jgi:hypothetical protein
MRIIIALSFVTCLALMPNYSFAAGQGKTSMETMANEAISTIKENPGTSAGVAACGIAIVFFPPAALVCGGTLAAGVGVDQSNK